MNALRALAARRRVNLDLAVQGIVLVGQTDVAFSSSEQRLEHGAEVLPHLPERFEEEGLGRLVDLACRLLQRMASGDEVVALGHEKLEPLHLLGVLVDRKRVHWSHLVYRALEPLVLLAQPLDVSRDLRRLRQQLVQRLAPLGFHAGGERLLAPQHLGALELETVLLLAEGVERPADLVDASFRAGELRLGAADPRLGLSRGGLERSERVTPVLERVFPLGPLDGERGRVVIERRDLLPQVRRLPACHRRLVSAARGSLARRGAPGLHLSGFDLPAHALFARPLLPGLQVFEPGALAPQPLVQPHALQLPLL